MKKILGMLLAVIMLCNIALVSSVSADTIDGANCPYVAPGATILSFDTGDTVPTNGNDGWTVSTNHTLTIADSMLNISNASTSWVNSQYAKKINTGTRGIISTDVVVTSGNRVYLKLFGYGMTTGDGFAKVYVNESSGAHQIQLISLDSGTTAKETVTYGGTWTTGEKLHIDVVVDTVTKQAYLYVDGNYGGTVNLNITGSDTNFEHIIFNIPGEINASFDNIAIGSAKSIEAYVPEALTGATILSFDTGDTVPTNGNDGWAVGTNHTLTIADSMLNISNASTSWVNSQYAKKINTGTRGIISTDVVVTSGNRVYLKLFGYGMGTGDGFAKVYVNESSGAHQIQLISLDGGTTAKETVTYGGTWTTGDKLHIDVVVDTVTKQAYLYVDGNYGGTVNLNITGTDTNFEHIIFNIPGRTNASFDNITIAAANSPIESVATITPVDGSEIVEGTEACIAFSRGITSANLSKVKVYDKDNVEVSYTSEFDILKNTYYIVPAVTAGETYTISVAEAIDLDGNTIPTATSSFEALAYRENFDSITAKDGISGEYETIKVTNIVNATVSVGGYAEAGLDNQSLKLTTTTDSAYAWFEQNIELSGKTVYSMDVTPGETRTVIGFITDGDNTVQNTNEGKFEIHLNSGGIHLAARNYTGDGYISGSWTDSGSWTAGEKMHFDVVIDKDSGLVHLYVDNVYSGTIPAKFNETETIKNLRLRTATSTAYFDNFVVNYLNEQVEKSIVLMNGDEQVETLPLNTSTLTLNYTGGFAKEVMVILAIYDDDNRLIDVAVENINAPETLSSNAAASVAFDTNYAIGTGYTIKGFAWIADTIQPVAEAISYTN